MKSKTSRIDIKQSLLLYSKVREEGVNEEGKYCAEGFKVWTDFDGYTVFIEYASVKLTIFFHNRYDIDFAKPDDLDQFTKAMNRFVDD